MTIKEYILDALEKFWTKVSTYIDGLTERVTTAESKMTDLTTRRATTVTVFSSMSAAVHRIGNTVTVTFTGTPGIALPESAATVVGTLPTGYRPSARSISMLYASTAILNGKYPQITFNTNGNIEVYNWGGTYAANAGWVRGMYTFVTNDA